MPRKATKKTKKTSKFVVGRPGYEDMTFKTLKEAEEFVAQNPSAEAIKEV